MQALQQDFSALTSRDKMRFLRWAAESVGAHLDIVFGDTEGGPLPKKFGNMIVEQAMTVAEHATTLCESTAEEKLIGELHDKAEAEVEIPKFLRRKK